MDSIRSQYSTAAQLLHDQPSTSSEDREWLRTFHDSIQDNKHSWQDFCHIFARYAETKDQGIQAAMGPDWPIPASIFRLLGEGMLDDAVMKKCIPGNKNWLAIDSITVLSTKRIASLLSEGSLYVAFQSCVSVL